MAKQLDENLSMGLDLDGDGKPDLNISIKTIGMMVVGIVTMAGIWFTLKSDIARAMELPEPVVSAVEFSYKDEMIRATIELTQLTNRLAWCTRGRKIIFLFLKCTGVQMLVTDLIFLFG